MARLNAFTVDLEDWYQGLTSTNIQPDRWQHLESRVEASTERLLAILASHNARATFFVLGRVADCHPDLVRRIDAAGHEIGVHGYWHRAVHQLSPQEFASELDRTLEALHPLVSQPIIGHRAPYFSINGRALWALDMLREKGFRYDSSFFPTRNMLYGYPEAPRFPHRVRGNGLVEFPMSTARWGGITWPIAGGFYVRTWPYAVIRAGIKQLNHQGQPAVLYMHPWELDTEQHYSHVTFRERITHYHGRQSLPEKLDRLFGDFRFTSLGDVLEVNFLRSSTPW
jgi:polysaccharide deacetylase family protein (PEP-CTERM system associated)